MRPTTFLPCMLLGLAGAAVGTSNYTQMVSVELQASYWTNFLECIGNLSSLYDISVSETGWVNIGPIENRDPDLNGTDAQLYECVTAANNRLLASVDYNGANSEDAGPVPLDEVTHEWLVSGGARGQEPRPMSSDLNLRGLKKRASKYTVRVSARAKDCSATTAYTPYTETCETKPTGFYRSIRALNQAFCETLTVAVWPHHNCPNSYGGGASGVKYVFANAGSNSECFNSQRTYSYSGDTASARTCNF